ncbi:hypothetical protein [Marinobacter adhaerens]|uniref:hypothetical protein n=1 Tax=Marinobacter adhaerens TaxID=1033846 RepID=UPI003D2BF6FB
MRVSVSETLASLADLGERKAIALDVEREINENEGFLEEVARLMAGAKDGDGRRAYWKG